MNKILLGALGIDKTFSNITFWIHRLIKDTYNSLTSVADLLGKEDIARIISDFRNNLYILIGIFMVFRLGISLINYLINPDAISDKQAGAGKMLTRIVTSFLLLIGMPIIFGLATDLQTAILGNDGALDNLMHIVKEDYSSNNSNKNFNAILIDNVSAEGENCGGLIPTTKKKTSSGGLKNVAYKDDDFHIGCKYDANQYEQIAINTFKDKWPEITDIQKCDGIRQNSCYEIIVHEKVDEKYTEDDIIVDSNVNAYQYWDYATTVAGTTTPEVAYVLQVELTVSKMAKKELTCYYTFNKSSSERNQDESTGTVGTKTTTCCGNSFVKLNFNTSGRGNPIKKSGIAGLFDNETGWYVDVQTGTENGYTFVPFYFDRGDIYAWNGIDRFLDLLRSGKCPQGITDVECSGDGTQCYSTRSDMAVVFSRTSGPEETDRFTSGTTDFDKLKTSIAENCVNKQEGKYCIVREDGTTIDNNNLSDEAKEELSELGKITEECGEYDQGCSFARELLRAFGGDDVTKKTFDEWPHNESDMADGIESGKLKFNWFMSLILGLAVLFFLMAMAIEIIIRNFKIVIIQMIAPIPIIMYMNPNDKMFNEWIKQYAGAFLDLFIKLLGIKLVSILISQVINPIIANSNYDFFLTIAYLLATITFMKVVPDFVSKILGIKDMGGTLKDSMKMIKSGLMAGAGGAVATGAIAGNAIRNAYNAHKGGLGAKGAWAAAGRAFLGAPGAILRGAGGGWKGNVMSGAQGAWAKGTARSDLYRQGVGAGTQMTAGLLGSMGLDYASRKDKDLENIKAEQENLKRAQSYKDNIQNIGMNGSNFGSDILNKKDANGNYVYSQDQRKTAAKAWAEAQYEAHNNGADFQKYCKDNGLTGTSKEEQKAYKDAYISSKLLYDSNLDFMDDADKLAATYESGKAAQITENVRDAQSFTQLEIKGVTRDEDGKQRTIKNVNDVFDMEGDATKKHTANSNTINEQTVNDPKYVAAAAARDAVKKGKN